MCYPLRVVYIKTLYFCIQINKRTSFNGTFFQNSAGCLQYIWGYMPPENECSCDCGCVYKSVLSFYYSTKCVITLDKVNAAHRIAMS